MLEFIKKLEKEFNAKISRSSVFSHGKNSFDLNKDGTIKRLYLFEVNLKNLETLLPIADQLCELSIEDCPVENLDVIKHFTNLDKLNLSFIMITKSALENLVSLKKLKDLRLSYTKGIDDTSPLGDLTGLEELRLNDCDIEEVKGLEKLNNLK